MSSANPKINPAALIEMYESGEDAGVCTACGHIAHGVEPDADGYRCEACGRYEVKGVEILLMEIA